MNHTLTFSVPEDATRPAMADVQAYFDARALYDVGNREALYRNTDTHTQFRFAWGDEALPETERMRRGTRDAARPLDVHFELPYLRPHVWALEATPEVAAFAAHFGLLVGEATRGAAAAQPFGEDSFVRAWTRGNHRTYREHQQRGGAPLVTLPRALRERHWRWNLQRSARAAALGAGVAIPPIAYVHHDDRLQAAVMWDDAQNIALPDVDLILLARQTIARRRYFLFRHPSAALVRTESLAPLLGLGEHVDDGGVRYWLLRAPKPPRRVIAFFNAQPPFTAVPQGVPAENVHEAEEVDAALTGSD